MLLRFYSPTGGRIELDGEDIAELKTPDLRAAFGLVSQDVFLFYGSVAENIAYGRDGASQTDIENPARAAEAQRSLSFGRACRNGPWSFFAAFINDAFMGMDDSGSGSVALALTSESASIQFWRAF